MKLQEFIDKNFAGNVSNFAKAYGVTRQTVYNILSGATQPQTKLRESLKRKGVRFEKFEKKETFMKISEFRKIAKSEGFKVKASMMSRVNKWYVVSIENSMGYSIIAYTQDGVTYPRAGYEDTATIKILNDCKSVFAR